ncbi:CHC2 zinc finger domain-containing protein [Gammaproteobacteria bacterium]|nr:CHC2 zinc finger domain-containing protein [Gammaproteobacteria bacterium]
MPEYLKGPIPRSLAMAVCDAADIVLVIGSRIHLRKLGKNYAANCPFCDKPDFSVSEVKRFFHCFSCERSGSSLNFLIEYEHMEFIEALEYLAKMEGLELFAP